MAKQVQKETDVEELLETAEQTIDRLKTLYEQYFMGIQKQAPSFIHNDLERKIRDLTQLQLRNTGLRYRLATLQQKFGSYNSYWRRTLRQIENGTYARQLQKIGRDAVRTGANIPEEILAAMPKRMREQVVRDRDNALAIARRRQQPEVDEPPEADADFIAMIKEPTEVRRKLKSTDGAHLLDGNDDFDIDAFFAEVEQSDDKPAAPARARVATRQPMNRSRPTTTGDLIRSGTRPTRDFDKRADTQPIAPIRADTEPGLGPLPRASTRADTEGAATPPRGAKPPPVPGRATAAMPVIRDESDDRQATKRPAFARPASLADDFGTSPQPRAPTQRATGPEQVPIDPLTGLPVRAPTVLGRATSSVPVAPGTGPQPAMPARAASPHAVAPGTGPQPAMPPRGIVPTQRATGPQPIIPSTRATGPQPTVPRVPAPDRAGSPSSSMPSQASRPNPIAPGSAAARGVVPVESMAGPFPRPAAKTPSVGMPAIPKPAMSIPNIPKPPPIGESAVIVTKTPAVGTAAINRNFVARTPAQGVPIVNKPQQKPPPGMTDADVNALYAKYVKAKEMVGEKVGPGEHGKLLKTINAQAPKIMEQYKASGVDFSVVVKDNQVIIRAKPKT